jgi:hypothetical protein
MSLRVLIFLLFSLRLNAQSDTDSFLVEGKDFKGYIMPISSYRLFYHIKDENLFRPTKSEVLSGEKILSGFLSEKCSHPVYDIDSMDCDVIDKELPYYFRQYTGYVDSVSGHRILYIQMVSKEMQGSIDEIKKTWMGGVDDGGPIFFYAYIDLNTGKCIQFFDNGWG